MLKRMSWILALVAVLMVVFGLTSAQAADGSGTYDGISWRVENKILILGAEGETQTLTARDSRTATDWPWYNYGKVYNESNMSYDYGIWGIKVEGTVIAQGSLSYMFADMRLGANAIATADLRGLDTSRVTDMSHMFTGFYALLDTDLSCLDTSSVTDMSYMFYHAGGNMNADSVHFDFDTWDTSNVTTMEDMFCGADIHGGLDLSCFDTSNVTNVNSMFFNCNIIGSYREGEREDGVLNISGFSFPECRQIVSMFGYIGVDQIIFGESVQFRDGVYLNALFDNADIEVLDLSSWDVSNVRMTSSLFDNATSLKTLDLSGWNPSQCEGFSCMFRNCSALITVDVSGWDTSNVNSFESMFENCSSLTSIDVSGFDFTNATRVRSMFEGCSALITIDCSSWVITGSMDARWLFCDCKNIKELDVSGFAIENGQVTGMFYGCSELVRIKLGPTTVFRMENTDSTCYLPATTQTNEYAYTGKWLREDNAYGPYTPEELTQYYQMNMAGWWELEKDFPTAYIVLVEDDDNTAYFVKTDADTIFAGGSVSTVPSISGESYTGIVYPIDFDEARTWSSIASRIKHVVVVDRLMPPNISGWFTNFSACEDFELDLLDTSLVTSFAGLFSGCSSMKSFDASDLEMENVTDMSGMFSNCASLTSFDSTDCHTTAVTNMTSMFSGCSSVTSFDFTNDFDTSNVTVMNGMFSGCSSVVSLDLSSFDVGSVTSISYMFSGCSSLETLDTSGWNTSNMTTISGAFNGTKFSALDLTHWDVSNVQYMDNLFISCKATGDINLTGWDVRNVKSVSSFANGFTGHLIMPDMKWESLTSNGNMFYSRGYGSVLDIPNWSFGQLTSLYYMFAFGHGDVNAENWDLTGVTQISNAFRQTNGSYDVEDEGININVKGWHSDTVRWAVQVFNYSSGLKYIHMEDWDFPNLESIEEMFGACSRLVHIYGVETLNVSKVTNMAMLFYNDSQLEDVDLSSWEANLTGSIGNMFYNCSKLTYLDLHGINTSGVTSMSSVFSNCINLEYLDMSGFDASGLTSSSYGSFFDGFGMNHNLRTVVIGDKNPFQGGAYTGTGLQLPMVPTEKNGVQYSGKWVREDYLYGPYTPSELRTEFQPAFEGTWIWDEGFGTGYTIIFEAPAGTLGSMPMTFAPSAEQMFTLPENQFRRPGANFSCWRDEELGRSYYYGYIDSNVYTNGQIVCLTAVFDSDGGGAIDMSDGGFEFSLKKNQKAIFRGLPVNTEYQVYEKTPSGWVLIMEEDSSGVIEGNGMSSAAFANKYIPNQCSLILSGEKFFNDRTANQDEFQFELLDEDGNVVSTATTGASGDIIFDALTFTEADMGREIYYTVREVLPRSTDVWHSTADEGITYDAHEEKIKVIVSYQLSDDTVIVSHTDNFDDYGNRLNPFIPLDNAIVRYYHTMNMNDDKERNMESFRSDGSPKGDYEYKSYASVVTIPNAAKLHLRIEYTNPRGQFCLWGHAYDEAKTGTWSSDCNPDNALRRFSGNIYDEIYVEEIDIPGNSFSAYYYSYPLPVVASNYNELSNFGYHITVTVTDFVKAGSVRADGSLISDYTSNKNMSDVITIPGAEKLHVELSYSVPRGYFYIWEGNHPEVGNGTSSFDDSFSGNTALKSYTWSSADDNKILTDSFDVDGDSLSVLYYSYARTQADSWYGENVNYGYCMEVTPVGLSGNLGSYNVTSSTPNVWPDGTQHGNYAVGKDYVDVVSIPGAKNLYMRIYFNMGSNDRLRLFKGNHPDYDNDTPTNAQYISYMTGYTSGYYTYTIPGDTATFIFHADANSTGGSGLGYYAIVMPSNSLGELHAEAEYDADGAVFQNESGTGYLTLYKASNDDKTSDKSFVFELSFYDEFGQLYDLDTDIEYHDDDSNLPLNLVTVYHVGRYPTGAEKVLYTERYPQIQVGEPFTLKAKSFEGFDYTENDYVDNLSVDGLDDTAAAEPKVIHMYYDSIPHTLTIKYQLFNENNTLVGTPYTETRMLAENAPISLDLKQYDGFAYIGNTGDLKVSDDLSMLVDGKMSATDKTITVKYRTARVINLFKGATGDDLTYHIKLERYEGLNTISGITFVDGEADVLLRGDGTVVTLAVPAGTYLNISRPDDATFNVKGSYKYLSGSTWYENTLGSSNITLYNNKLISAGPYTIGLYEDAQIYFWYKRVCRRADGTEYVSSTYAYRYPGEKVGYMGTSFTSTLSERVNGVYQYYIFNGEQNMSPDDIIPKDPNDIDYIQYYVPAVEIRISYLRISNSGSQYSDGYTYYSYGPKNADWVYTPRSYSGYHADSVECTGDSTVSLSVNEAGQIVGRLGNSSTLTIRVICRQN